MLQVEFLLFTMSVSERVSRWTVVQRKTWLRENCSNAPLVGRRCELADRVSDIMSTMTLEKKLGATEHLVQFLNPLTYDELPPVGNPGWISKTENFHELFSDIEQEYLRSYEKYSKTWNTGIRLIHSANVYDVEFHNGDGNVVYCKAKCHLTMRLSPPLYVPFALLGVNDGVLVCIKGASCSCKAGLIQSCVHITALLILYSELGGSSCTSEPCLWNQPSDTIAPIKASSLQHCAVRTRPQWEDMLMELSLLLNLLVSKKISTVWSSYRQIDSANSTMSEGCFSSPSPDLPDPRDKL